MVETEYIGTPTAAIMPSVQITETMTTASGSKTPRTLR